MKRKVFGSYTTIFEQYDKSRRKRDFVRLKELCEFKFGIDHVWEDSFQIPIFDENTVIIQNMYLPLVNCMMKWII